MPDANDWNTGIIEEFRANAGVVGGPFEGRPLLLLTATGARSGNEHTTPLMFLTDGDRLVVVASKGGAPEDPQWYRNLEANPDATVELGTERFPVRAAIAEGAERDALFAHHAEVYPQFAEYAAQTDRVIPVITLVRTG
jgi:deazaflavin-dependent oxidoreductase (nitroreductase family)